MQNHTAVATNMSDTMTPVVTLHSTYFPTHYTFCLRRQDNMVTHTIAAYEASASLGHTKLSFCIKTFVLQSTYRSVL